MSIWVPVHTAEFDSGGSSPVLEKGAIVRHPDGAEVSSGTDRLVSSAGSSGTAA
jgi:hypothetical protein